MGINDMVAKMLGLEEDRKSWRIADPDRLQSELERRFGRVTRSNGHNGLELVCDCPVCGKHKLSVNAESGVYKCWVGCMSGHVRKLLKTHVEMTHAPVRQKKREYGYIDPGELTPLEQVAPDNLGAVYLKSRGFDANELGRDFGFAYCGSGRKFAHGLFNTTGTVVAQVVMNGKTVGWQARLTYDPLKLTDDQCRMLGLPWDPVKEKFERPPKYMTMPGMDKREVLWNFDNARKSDTVVVCEGVYDAARVGKCAVATLGKSVSDQQVSLLQQYWNHVVILLDPDAEKDAVRLKTRFGATTDVVLVRLKGYKDAGEAPRKAVWEQVLDAADGQGSDPSRWRISM